MLFLHFSHCKSISTEHAGSHSSLVFMLVKYEYTSAVFMWHFEFIALEINLS